MAGEDATNEPEPARCRVLVVDDSATVRHAVRALLERHGFAVTTVGSGEDAFAICGLEPFEVVLTDLTMGALGGAQLCRLLRSTPQTATIPIVMLTAATQRRDRFWARHAGADAYVSKEAMLTELPAVLARVARPAPSWRGTGRPPPQPALERLSSLHDELLFGAVLASDVNRLVKLIDDPRALAGQLIKLAGDVVDAHYLVLTLSSPALRTHTVLVRGGWPEDDVSSALAALGLDDPSNTTIFAADALRGARFDAGERAVFTLELGGEKLGELRAFGGPSRISGRDFDTLGMLVCESALVVKAAVLGAQTRALARTDVLTGIANRRAMVERLEHEISVAQRRQSAASVVICDVDHFKSVNDTYGHAMGDEVLRTLAKALARTVRGVDLVGRWGGEEFIAIFPDATETGVRIAAERLRMAIERLPPFAGGPARVTASFGAMSWIGAATLDAIIERADQALYRAKARGRNRVEVEVSEP